jgi:hypothetical protein
MISNEQIKRNIIPKISKLRPLDITLIQSFTHNNNLELISELRKFQNKDYGFGNGLEADIQLPQSNIASTCIAINLLEDIKETSIKEELNKEIVSYLEEVYDSSQECFHMVPKEVDDHPHAIWWNYDTLDSFTWGNPNPEIIGYLYKHRQYLRKLDINYLITKTIDYIRNTFQKEASMHSVLSVLRFYKRCDRDVKNLIKDDLQKIVLEQVEIDSSKWGNYVLEPYLVAIIDKSFLATQQDILVADLEVTYNKLLQNLPSPNWQWYQFEEVFEKVKDNWVGLLTYNQIKALRINRK